MNNLEKLRFRIDLWHNFQSQNYQLLAERNFQKSNYQVMEIAFQVHRKLRN